MSTEPDEIRADIERTRAELSSDVDALTDKVSPSQAARRQADRLRSAATSVKDRVVGAASDGTSAVSDTASGLPEAARDRARGNPLAVGLIAFGAGWLASALLPSTRQEQGLAQSAKEQAAPVVEQVKGAAQEMGANLKEPAK
jgi:cell division septum initiation protein DivIVA